MLKAIRKFINEEKPYAYLLVLILFIYSFLMLVSEKTAEVPSPGLEKIKTAERLLKDKSKDPQFIMQLVKEDRTGEILLFLFGFLIFLAFLAGLIIDIAFLTNKFYRIELIRPIQEIAPVAWGWQELAKVVILFVGVSLVLSIYLAISKHLFFKDWSENFFLLLHTTITDLAMLAFVFYFAIKKYGGQLKSLGINLTNWLKDLFLGVFSYLGILPIFILVLTILVIVANLYSYQPPPHPLVEVFVAEDRRNPGLIVYSLVLGCVVGPIIEEIFFRGFCYPALKKICGMKISMIIIASAFAFIHKSAFAFWPIFILGILLTYVYEKRGTLLPSIVIHIAHNSLFISYFFLIKRSLIDQIV